MVVDNLLNFRVDVEIGSSKVVQAVSETAAKGGILGLQLDEVVVAVNAKDVASAVMEQH